LHRTNENFTQAGMLRAQQPSRFGTPFSTRRPQPPDGLRQLHCAAPGFSIASCISCEQRPDTLAEVISADHGKIISNAKGEVQRGVVAGITPFNFPAMVPMWMFPVALACGNCFIVKPSERDP
jgi:hypothetical protein